MDVLTPEQIEQMSKAELYGAAKVRGIKYGRLSLFQIREQLKEWKEPVVIQTTASTSNEQIVEEVPVKTKKTVAKKKVVKPVKKERKVRTGTKMQKCREIVENNPKAERKEIIKLFMSKAGLSKAGSATYFQLLKKK